MRDIDSGEPNPGDLLKELLNDFATRSTAERRASLFQLVASLKELAVQEIVESLVHNEFQQRLEKATNSAIKTPYLVEGREIVPWDGGFCIVVLNRRGDIIGAQAHPAGRSFAEHDKEPSFPYVPALKKAIFRLHLDLGGKERGLDDEDNFRSIANLGFSPREDLFIGEALASVLHIGRMYTGVSGCGLKEDYVKGLLPTKMDQNYAAFREHSADLFTGEAEQSFARIATSYLVHPQPSHPFREPAFFAKVRNRAH